MGCPSPTSSPGHCWPASFPPQPQWQAIVPGGRPGALPPRLRPLGAAPADPGRQRLSLGPELRAAAGPGVMATRLGRGTGVDPPVPAAAQRQGRALQWGDPAMGRAVGLRDPVRVAGAVGPRVPDPAGEVSVDRGSSADRSLPRAVPDRAAVPCRRGRPALGPVARRSLPGRTGDLPAGQRAGAIWLYGWGRGLGRIHRGKDVCVRFDVSSHYLIASDHQGQESKRLPAKELSRERMMALAVGCKRAHRQKSKRRG